MAYTILETVLDPEYDPGSDFGPIALRKRTITPQRRVREVRISSGRYYKGSVSYTPRVEEEYEPIRDLWHLCTQGNFGCLFFDHKEFELVDELIGVGDDTNAEFQLKKGVTIAGQTVYRKITRPVHGLTAFSVNGVTYDDTLVVKVNGVEIPSTDWTIDRTTGLLTFDPGSEPGDGLDVTVSCAYLVPIWFTDIKFPVVMEGGGTFHIKNLGVEEIVID